MSSKHHLKSKDKQGTHQRSHPRHNLESFPAYTSPVFIDQFPFHSIVNVLLIHKPGQKIEYLKNNESVLFIMFDVYVCVCMYVHACMCVHVFVRACMCVHYVISSHIRFFFSDVCKRLKLHSLLFNSPFFLLAGRPIVVRSHHKSCTRLLTDISFVVCKGQ